MTQAKNVKANFDWLQAGKVEHFPEYKVQTQKTIFDRIAKAKRSTFDRSKFTVVGNPNITDDGIASGFSVDNYINLINNFNPQNSWEIIIKVKTDGSTNSYFLGNLTPSNARNLTLGVDSAGGFKVWLSSNGTSWNITTELWMPGTHNEYLFIKLGFTGTQYYLEKSLDKKIWTNRSTVDSSLKIYPADLLLGISYGSEFATKGFIDLKEVYIVSDGVEVFNGNKTGIDQIKKDDFEIVGSPVISADGIASGFSGVNFLTLNTKLNNNCRITTKFKVKHANREQRVFSVLGNSSLPALQDYFALVLNASNELILRMLNRNGDFFLPIFSLPIEDNIDIWVRLEIVGSTAVGFVSYDGNHWEQKGSIICYDNIASVVHDTGLIAIGEIGNTFEFNGSIDLNAFKIYIDDQLVYQPTLRIPYTLSKQGSKIVDSVYRDRVQDMYEQFGYTHYYTLSGNDYTLQTVPNETIVDSYYADNSFMELTADLTLTQGGGAVSGQTVNLKRPYKNNKYISSIGTTSKATTSFVPSASGQWITKGKGVL